ncbi:hypothetical protein DEO72_LG8g2918 [Vigna unguiculata]|uniref:Uncharacterized protein n=1 Tax=Vigna unguiculata TaxID=3917 RepID=A0A4D6MYD1_VIGUN|nr:hypothetical protein DEO72_LG8g2918 [Vigna unguiculata]
MARPSEYSRKPDVLSACVLVQARDFGFGQVVVSSKREIAECYCCRTRSSDNA